MNRALWNFTVGLPALIFIVALGLGVWILTREAPYAAPFGEVGPFETLRGPLLGLGDTTLEGQVVDAEGQPIPDATVITIQGDRVRRGITDQGGAFQLPELAQGTVHLTILVLNRLPTMVTVPVGAGPQRITVSNAQQAPPVPANPNASDLELELLLASSGDTPEGMTLAFEPVGVPSAGDRAPRRITLSQGTNITVPNLPHGSWTVRLLPMGGSSGLDWDLLQPVGTEPTQLSHPGPEPLPLIAHTGTIQGVLLGHEGQPIAGALVLALPAQGEGLTLPPAMTNASGQVRFPLVPTGDWIIRWRARGAGAEARVTVERGATANPFP